MKATTYAQACEYGRCATILQKYEDRLNNLRDELRMDAIARPDIGDTLDALSAFIEDAMGEVRLKSTREEFDQAARTWEAA